MYHATELNPQGVHMATPLVHSFIHSFMPRAERTLRVSFIHSLKCRRWRTTRQGRTIMYKSARSQPYSVLEARSKKAEKTTPLVKILTYYGYTAVAGIHLLFLVCNRDISSTYFVLSPSASWYARLLASDMWSTKKPRDFSAMGNCSSRSASTSRKHPASNNPSQGIANFPLQQKGAGPRINFPTNRLDFC
eukprot:492754-Amphidinium_carterae.1